MIGKKITEQEPVTLAEVRVVLSSRREEGDLLYEQSIALDHANKFSRLDVDAAKKLVEELVEAGVRRDLACSLVDILPESEQEIRMLFPKERFSSDDTLVSKIMSSIRKYGES